MSALPVISPIQRLDCDILFCIFNLNADMYEDHRALETTLAASRVCRGWRSFMLSITSIWAHLIDLDHRLWRAVEGRHELIRRSGTALLCMKSHHLYPTRPWMKHLLKVVGENWTRVKRFEVTISARHTDQWSLLYLPAPHLESFGITFPKERREFEHVLSSLFGGSAPRLRELHFVGHMSNFIIAPSSWLYQLRSIDLDAELTVSQTLEVLMSTENLVNLRLHQTVADRTAFTLPLVSLPALAQFNLNLCDELAPGAVLLDHLRIPPACLLTISAESIQRKEIDKKATLAPIIRAISTCARRCCTHHVPRRLGLIITSRQFSFGSAIRSDGPTFTFCMELDSQQTIPGHTLNMLLSEFTLPNFSKVTSFGIRIGGVNRPVPGFTAFMACLPAVKVIKTDKESLRHLRAHSAIKGADTGPQIGFPALKILTLQSFIPSRGAHSKFDDACDPISKFVMARIEHGHAISIVDFTGDTLDVLPDMAFLKKAEGLKVHWRQRGVAQIRKYTCGTGVPRTVAVDWEVG